MDSKNSSGKLDFGAVLNIQPVDEENTEYVTVQINVNGVRKDVRVPLSCVKDQNSASSASKVLGVAESVDSSVKVSVPQTESADGKAIKHLFSELEEQVGRQVKAVSSFLSSAPPPPSSSSSTPSLYSKVIHDVNKNQMWTSSGSDGSVVDVTSSGLATSDSDIKLDNVIVIEPDNGDADEQSTKESRQEKDTKMNGFKVYQQGGAISYMAVSKVTPLKAGKAGTGQTGSRSATSNQVVIASGPGIKEQYMMMSKKGAETLLTPIVGLTPHLSTANSCLLKTARSTAVLRLTPSQVSVLRKDGSLYLPVDAVSAHRSLLKTVFPIVAPSSLNSDVNPVMNGQDSLVTGVRKTSKDAVPTETKAGAVTSLPTPGSVVISRATSSSANPVLSGHSVSVVESPANNSSLSNIRISSVRSLLQDDVPIEKEPLGKEGSSAADHSTSDKCSRGILHAMINDLCHPVSGFVANRIDADDGDHPTVTETESEGRRNGGRTETPVKCAEGRDTSRRSEGGEINPLWLKGFKEDPQLRVVVQRLDLGPRFKSCHVDRLRQHLANRRRQKKCELLRNASEHVHPVKQSRYTAGDGCSSRPASGKEQLAAEGSIPDKMVMIKTSAGSYLLPMVPGMTLKGLVHSLKSGSIKLPPVKSLKQMVAVNKNFVSPAMQSGGWQTSNDGRRGSTAPATDQLNCNQPLVTVKGKPVKKTQQRLVQIKPVQCLNTHTPISVTELIPATHNSALVCSPAMYSMVVSSKSSSTGQQHFLLKRSAWDVLPSIPSKKPKDGEDEDPSLQIQVEKSSSGDTNSVLQNKEENSEQAKSLSSVDRIKLLKEKLKQQEAAIEEARKQRQKTTELLKGID